MMQCARYQGMDNKSTGKARSFDDDLHGKCAISQVSQLKVRERVFRPSAVFVHLWSTKS